jgi:hypothetical protein
MRPVRHQHEHRQAARDRDRRDGEDHALPGQVAAEPADQVRQRRAQHQRPDQPAERQPEVAVVPARGDLHAHGVKSGEEDAGRETRREQRQILAAGGERRAVRRRTRERAEEEDHPRRMAVGDRQPGEDQRPGDEAQLHRDRHVAHGRSRQPGRPLQIRHHRIAGKPQRRREKLRDDDRRQDPGRNGGQGVVLRLAWCHG